VDEARRVAALARAHGIIVAVGHTERFNPAVRAVAEMRLTPRYIEVDRVSPMTFRSLDVGVVFDLMIHDLDIVLMMTRAALRDVYAVGVRVLGEQEDLASAWLTFADGCLANLTASRLALKTERKLRVFTESAYLSLDYAKRQGVVLSLTENREALERLRALLAEGADLSALDSTQIARVRQLELPTEDPLTL
jgi:predicted dehydrogenase